MASQVLVPLPGYPFRNLPAASSLAALRAMDVSAIADGSNVSVNYGSAPNDSGGGLFSWTAASIANDNGATIIKPDMLSPLQAGRWTVVGVNKGVVADAVDGAVDGLSDALASDKGAAKIGVKRDEANTVVEVLADYSQRIVYPQSWGVKGDGLTDDGPALQRMIDSLSGGETISVGAMAIRCNQVVRQNKPLTWLGRAKENVSTFIAGAPDSDLFYLYDHSGSAFERLHYKSAVTRTTGSYINIYNANRIGIREFFMEGHALGISAGLCVKLDIVEGFFWQARPRSSVSFGSSIQLGNNGYTGSVTIDKCLASNQQNPDVYGDSYQPFAWLDLIHADIVNVNDCSPQLQGMGVVIRPGWKQFVTYLTIKGGVLDTSRQAMVVKPNGGWTSHISMLGVTSAVSNVLAAIVLDGSVDYLDPNNVAVPSFDVISDFSHDVASRCINNTAATTGMLVRGKGVDGVQIGGYFGNNGDGASHGIDIDLQAGTNIDVSNVFLGARGPTPASEVIGINVASGVTGSYRAVRSAGIASNNVIVNNASSTFVSA